MNDAVDKRQRFPNKVLCLRGNVCLPPLKKGDRGGFVFRPVPYCEFPNSTMNSLAGKA